MDSIKIEISGNAEALQPTVDKLKEVGAVDKQNAEQFKVTNKEFIDASLKRQKLLDAEKQDLEELRKMKKLAFSPEEIRQYEKSIKDTEGRIKLLSAETGAMKTSMAGVVTQTNAMGEAVKKSYGFLRLAANIIPGLGISGAILLGYEALSSLLENITGSFDENTEAINVNNEALQENIENFEKLNELLNTQIVERLKLNGQLQDADALRFKADEEYSKRTIEINKTKLKQIADLAVANKMSVEDFKQYSSKISYFGKLNAQESAAIIEAIRMQDTEGLPRDLDRRLSIMSDYYDKIQQYEISANQEQIQNDLILNETVSNINSKAYNEDVKKHKQKNVKKKTDEDDWWKWYLKMWEKNFHELLQQYKKDTDNFLDEQKRKWDGAVKRNEENTALIIEDMQIQASMTKDLVDDENASFQERLNNRKVVLTEEGKETKESLDHLEMLKKQHEHNLKQIEDKSTKEKDKKRDEDVQKEIAAMKQIADFAIQLFEQRIQSNIEYYDRQADLQKDAVDAQRRQAELGHDNTLAFEEKRQADIERDRMNEQKKLVKLKELETFLNAVASFSKDDPKSAVAKALAQLAIVKGVEATFAEEGGLLGKNTGEKSLLSLNGLSRKHKSGNDILVHAEVGEGLLSTREISNMGGDNAFIRFKNMLANPLSMPEVPLSGVMFQGMNTRKLEDKVDELNRTIKNKPDLAIDFDKMGNMIVTKTENGIKEAMTYILRKPRING